MFGYFSAKYARLQARCPCVCRENDGAAGLRQGCACPDGRWRGCGSVLQVRRGRACEQGGKLHLQTVAGDASLDELSERRMKGGLARHDIAGFETDADDVDPCAV